MGKILDELRCESCNKKLSRKQSLYDTAWLGVYWCGKAKCAFDILESNCDEFDAEDPSNHEN